jgi:hypothetical protein
VYSHEKKQDSINEGEGCRNEADIRLLEVAMKLCARNLTMVRRERRGGEQVGSGNFSIYSSPKLGATKVLACLNRVVELAVQTAVKGCQGPT